MRVSIFFNVKKRIFFIRNISISRINSLWSGSVVVPLPPFSKSVSDPKREAFERQYVDLVIAEIEEGLDYVASCLDWSIPPNDRFI